ncbi:hypothetical protein GCM10009007_19900 [Formosimonas limnophila]|uniref:Uncharacterized protein n=1 Tax=Formosimonas limnophila TaxID=1384487 RepID=A0A8J3CJ09_9BURK|nr:hypothetical protein [Formosimonas limnophila]GHA78829.1 hypothetical protein GCM10009007_19900 [Formosimonas limnophila]
MFLQQELWLILLGFIVALVVKKTSGSPAPLSRVTLFASAASLLVGWFGMAAKGIWPALAFFPTDVRGVLITVTAAFLAAKFVVRRPRTTISKSRKK